MDNGGSVKRIDAIQKYKEGDEWLHALVYKFIDNKNIVTGGGLDEAPAGVVLDIICEAVAGGGCLLRLVLQRVAFELHPRVRNHGEGPY